MIGPGQRNVTESLGAGQKPTAGDCQDFGIGEDRPKTDRNSIPSISGMKMSVMTRSDGDPAESRKAAIVDTLSTVANTHSSVQSLGVPLVEPSNIQTPLPASTLSPGSSHSNRTALKSIFTVE